jgi:hypothetical protein
MPHKHPEDRIYTVMSGVFYIGLGDRFDDDKVKAYPAGSVIVLPGDTWHFHWAKSGESPHVRFDERGWETERRRIAQATAPILDSIEVSLPPRAGYVRSQMRTGLMPVGTTRLFRRLHPR